MLTSHRTTLLWLQQVLLTLLLLPVGVQAATPIESLDIQAKINHDGTVAVTQRISYLTPSQLDWRLFSTVRDLSVSRAGEPVGSNELSVRQRSETTFLSSKTFSNQWDISYLAPNSLIRHNDRDQLFIKLFDQSAVPIYAMEAAFFLPENIKGKTGLTGNLYSIGGVLDGTSKRLDNRRLRFSASYAGPDSLATISATWDKEIISLTTTEQAKLSLLQLDAAPWLAFGLLLPLSSLIVLMRLLWRQRRQEAASRSQIERPPSALPAALVGVLVRKKVYAEEIAALLIDLCQRGYLIIVKRSGSYFIAKRKPFDEHTAAWEREIIEEMFPAESTAVSEQNLQDLGNNRLYSPKVRDAFRKIYQVITSQSYFMENPHSTRIRHKLIGLALYYLSAVGMVWVAVSETSPYLILPLGGTMIVAVLIIKLTPRLAAYSGKGLSERESWLGFANYLKANKPLPFETSRNHTFEKYLPYAVALGVTLQWARRFDLSSLTVLKPDWFVSYEENTTVEFAKEVAGFTNQISNGITGLRGPLVS